MAKAGWAQGFGLRLCGAGLLGQAVARSPLPLAAAGLQGEGKTNHEGRAALLWALCCQSCQSLAWPFPGPVTPGVPALHAEDPV